MPKLYESSYWQLFESVQPLFASNIPWEVQDDSQGVVSAKIAIQNTVDLIKACMMETPIHFQIECVYTLDEIAFYIRDFLRPLLFILQELVHDIVMEIKEIDEVGRAILMFACLMGIHFMPLKTSNRVQ
ncbi:hypothetical protein M441DRAFT_49803 [Trichoderma asperellum CBS 433.97]|uniref:Uncharacterized protein n=1 Tax=Trichoderma asperellum (strain ATCC 204424 / CBS 433.97 / NBRC 101777) TaxID=1042311 RepID=A0A2T3Z0K1_TRIA4|nr:hypothetical protein M441DRAFT_49803 [Trichoderma asperellum CBS 433.97]PTB38352.1 hypothetical protein M441DRAFT_49803 [Trichoderma asperellum CBS 433.97]